jgi:hypothetical protein
MTKLITRGFATLFCAGLFAVLSASSAQAQQLSASPVDATVVVQDGTAQATFSVKVINNEQTAMTGFVITFKDGTTAALGDIDAQGSAVSDPQTQTIDVSNFPSASVPVQVTLTFTLNGDAVSMPWVISLFRS